MLLDRSDQAISSTDLQKNTREILDRLTQGKQDRYVVMRDNKPAAVLLPTKMYEALMDELADLRIEAIALERIATFDPEKALSTEQLKQALGLGDK
jgi:antitoxin StbD